MNTLVLGGSWSSNVGNAFYNIGADYLMKKIIGEGSVFFPESPRWKQLLFNDFDLVAKADVDHVVLMGPCLNLKLPEVYEETFRALYRRGIKVGYVSVGMSLYDEGEAQVIVDFLKKFPPAYISTRDQATYDFFVNKVTCPLYSGLCTSMYLNEAYQPVGLVGGDYVVYNFDGGSEPLLKVDADFCARAIREKNKPRNIPCSVNGLNIIRTCNDGMEVGYKSLYKIDQTYHSDLPWGYISILANAKYVFSERVHTCATGLIYGNKVQFIRRVPRSFEKRSLIFERLGIQEIFERPVALNMEYLYEEKVKMEQFLKEVISSL